MSTLLQGDAVAARFRRCEMSIAIGLGLRALLGLAALVFIGRGAFLSPDSASYLHPAEVISSSLAFQNEWGNPEIFRTPGYPIILAAGAWLGHPIAFALVINAVMTALIIMLTSEIVWRLSGSERYAAVAALAVAVEPTMLFWSLKVMPETLLTCCLLAFAGCALVVLTASRGRWAIPAAVFLLAATYTKPIVYPLTLLLVVATGLWALTRCPVRKHAWMFVVICSAGVGIWHLRNAVETGYAGFSTIADRVLYVSVGGSIVAHQDGLPFYEVRQRRNDEIKQMNIEGPANWKTRYQQMRHAEWTRLASHPIPYAAIHAAGMARTLFDPGAVEYFRLFNAYPESGGLLGMAVDQGLLRAVLHLLKTRPGVFWSLAGLFLLLIPYIVLPVLAAFTLTSRTRVPFLFLAVIAGYLLVASGGVFGSSRFRAPIVPLLVLMAACGSVHGSSRKRLLAAVGSRTL